MFQSAVVFLSSLFMCGNVFAGSVASVSLSTLSSALNERMLIMKDVASYKAQHHSPVEDVEREQKVLAEAVKNAQDAGLDPHSVEPFFRALMNASKAVQYRYLAGWLATPDVNRSVRSLDATRQQINQLDSELLTAISQRLLTGAFTEADTAWLSAQIMAPNLSEADKNNLLAALRLIHRAR